LGVTATQISTYAKAGVLEVELLTSEDIGHLVQLSKRQVRDKLVHTPGFPKPFLIGGIKRWDKEEVMKWIKTQRAGNRI
jgi:predicted DNA-binding transcriptional regulator AlpA